MAWTNQALEIGPSIPIWCLALFSVSYASFLTITWSACYGNTLHSCWTHLWPGDTMWWHWSGSTLSQVMACCLTAPSHYPNQCLLLIIEVLWHSPEGNMSLKITNSRLQLHFPVAYKLISVFFLLQPPLPDFSLFCDGHSQPAGRLCISNSNKSAWRGWESSSSMKYPGLNVISLWPVKKHIELGFSTRKKWINLASEPEKKWFDFCQKNLIHLASQPEITANVSNLHDNEKYYQYSVLTGYNNFDD